MPQARFKTAVLTSERLWTHSLDRTVTGIGLGEVQKWQ